MLMAHCNFRLKPLSIRLFQEIKHDQVGLLECKVGLLEYSETGQIGLFE